MREERTEERAAPGALPGGLRVYAIGDVHGCADRLARLLELIAEDAAAAAEAECRVVFLGDYVDRGPDSRGAIERVLAPLPFPAVTAALMGNHEAMMLDALERPSEETVSLWLANGALATLASYGVDDAAPAARWAGRVGERHLGFLRRLARRHAAGGYLFVHAGIRPGVPLAEQDEQDLIWIREPFLSSQDDHGAVIVHGHTPTREPVVRPNRIGIDTGAVYGGKLTAVALWADRMRFLHV